MDPAIVFENVHKGFAATTAVDDLSFTVPTGAVYGLLGPNGAGKTTSLRMLMAILLPDSGTIRVLGTSPGAGLASRVGYLPEERGLYQSMKVIENLEYFTSLRGLTRADARRRGGDWLERLGMSASADRRLQELSKGNQQKIQFITTVAHEPELLVLDEPFSGLDPVNQDLMRRTILDLSAAGTTVVLSTHLMDEVERLCSHLTLIHHGRAVVEGAIGEVRGRWGTDAIRMTVADSGAGLEGHPDVAELTRQGRSLEIRLHEGRDPSAFLADVAPRMRITAFEIQAPSIHSIFVRLVGTPAASPTEPPSPAAPAAPAGREPVR